MDDRVLERHFREHLPRVCRVDVVQRVVINLVRAGRRRDGTRPERAPPDADGQDRLGVGKLGDRVCDLLGVGPVGEVQSGVAERSVRSARGDPLVGGRHAVVELVES